MQFAYTILYVDDVPQMMDFYHRAFGFEIHFYMTVKTGENWLPARQSCHFAPENFWRKREQKRARATIASPFLKSPLRQTTFRQRLSAR